jgi:hypothetical protein
MSAATVSACPGESRPVGNNFGRDEMRPNPPFQAYSVNTKQFAREDIIAREMEDAFLRTYFRTALRHSDQPIRPPYFFRGLSLNSFAALPPIIASFCARASDFVLFTKSSGL